MPQHQETRILPYTPQQLFDLVLDIDQYPDFLPWCSYARVFEVGADYKKADLSIGYKIFQETFTSDVRFTAPSDIQVKYIKGPFKYLNNNWKFTKKANVQCQVDFFVDFEFRSRILEAAIGVIFTKAVFKMVQSFEKRAEMLYGANR